MMETKLTELLQALSNNDLVFFPIRHHSPACAWHLQQLIHAEKPTTILVEGPSDMTKLIPFILQPQTKAPFAVYTTYIDKAKRLGELAEELPTLAERRFAGYYPFCDYSPELVALKSGQEVGAVLQFIDLTFPEQILATKNLSCQTEVKIRALQEEQYLNRSAYLAQLAIDTGCRDQDDLWDHLFEANFSTISTSKFRENVAAYCFMARQDSSPETLEADGTIAREQAMASAIRQAQLENKGKILVITGGFHTVVLPFLVQEMPRQRQPLKLSPDESQTVLMRYSFEQLDAINGYGAGMPAPEFYQQFWTQIQDKNSNAALITANQLLVEIGKRTRQEKLGNALSTADVIAALTQACRLASFRHHAGPTREDLLDSIRSCFVKGAMNTEGAILMTLVRQMLTGNRVGDLPPDVGVPPIVENFRQLANSLRLKINTSLKQSLTLDIYRKKAHRQASRFMYILQFLEIPFGRLVAGPDYVQGNQLERIQEIWEYCWSPQTESTLIERSLYGATLEEAAINRLQQAITGLEDEGKGRSALEAVRMLINACRMGLHLYTERLLDLIAANIAEDPSFVSLVNALNQLILLWQSREPLEAHKLTQIPILITVVYQKCCYLLPNLINCLPEEVNQVLDAFLTVREVLELQGFSKNVGIKNQDSLERLDSDLFYNGLSQLLTQPNGNAVLIGGAAGMLYQSGSLTEEHLLNLAIGYLNSTMIEPGIGAGFLRGLLHTCREIAWRMKALLEAIDSLLATWDEEEFLRVLPEFRLAFADLTPRETDKVAELVAGLHGKKDLGDLSHVQLRSADLQLGLRLNKLLLESLEQDYLEQWK